MILILNNSGENSKKKELKMNKIDKKVMKKDFIMKKKLKEEKNIIMNRMNLI